MSKNRARSQKRAAQMKRLLERDGDRCHYCDRAMTFDKPQNGKQKPYNATFEHIVPIALGGPSVIENLTLACHKCNSKRNHSNEEHPGCGLCASARISFPVDPVLVELMSVDNKEAQGLLRREIGLIGIYLERHGVNQYLKRFGTEARMSPGSRYKATPDLSDQFVKYMIS